METAGILAKEFHLKAEHIQSIIILIDESIAFYASDTAKGAVFHENYHQIAQRMNIRARMLERNKGYSQEKIERTLRTLK